MKESFVAVCDMLLICPQNLCGILMNKKMHKIRKFSLFYLKHAKQDASSLILQIIFDVIHHYITSLFLSISKVGRISRTMHRQKNYA